MRALWATVIAPLLHACGPATVVEHCDADESLADLLEEATRATAGVLVQSAPNATGADVAIVHGRAARGDLEDALERLERAAGDDPYPLTLVHGADSPVAGSEPRAGLEAFVRRRPELELIHLPGMGGTAVLVSARRLERSSSPRLRRMLQGWRLGPPALAHLAAVEAERVRAEARASELVAELAVLRSGLELEASAQREELHRRMDELAEREAELTATLARRDARLASLEARIRAWEPAAVTAGFPGPRLLEEVSPEPELVDRRGVLVAPGASAGMLHAVVRMAGEPTAMRHCLWSLLARCDRPLALTMVADAEGDPRVRGMAEDLAASAPAAVVTPEPPVIDPSERVLFVDRPVTFGHRTIRTLIEAAEREGAERAVLAAEGMHHDVPAWAGIDAADLLVRAGADPSDALAGEEALAAALRESQREALAIAYVLPGLAPGGSGGSHSVVQEARALAEIGARARVLLPSESGRRAAELYSEADGLIVLHDSPRGLEAALEGFDVVVATEAPSARAVAAHVRRRPGVLGAYYVQDYEPLFSSAGGPSADAALLSYRQAEELLLFAKSHWIVNAVAVAHCLPVAKVQPSLDRATFHADGRGEDTSRPRVLAMVRPRTPRRRAHETLAALQRLKDELGDGIECLAFGCATEELADLPPAPGVDHLGVLSRAEVAEVLRRCDVFLDLSSYQAFGRTGLEAMACGVVPVLPERGGVTEYATAGQDALLVDTSDEDAVVAAAAALLGDRERLERLRAAGIRTAGSFSLVGAATSQYACFAAHLERRPHR